MSVSKLGIRVSTPFEGLLEKLEDATRAYFNSPVHVKLPISLVDPADPTFTIVHDAITVAVVDINHKSDDDSVVIMRAKVIDGSKAIKSVPVPSKGNSDANVEILCEGDDLHLVVDIIYGDAAIIKVSDSVSKNVDLNDLSSILCRLALPAGLPNSEGDPISWEDFVSGEESTGDDEGNGSGDGDDDNN